MAESLNEIFPDMPDFPDEIRLKLHRKYSDPYIFFSRQKQSAHCFCTSCFGTFDVPSKEIVSDVFRTCPVCGTKCKTRSEGIGRRSIFDERLVCYLMPTDGGNAVFAICGLLYNTYGKPYFRGGVQMTVNELAKHYHGSEFEIRNVIKYSPDGIKQADYYWRSAYETKFYEPYLTKGSYNYSARIYYTIENPEILKDTFMKYIPANYSGDKQLTYLKYALEYPAVEMLMKLGGERIISDIVDRKCSHKSVIDLSGKTAAEVFMTDPNNAAVIRNFIKENKNRACVQDLQIWKKLNQKEYKRKYKISEVRGISDFCFDYRLIFKYSKMIGTTLRKFMNYIRKQHDIYARATGNSIDHIMMIYQDYIDECTQLEYDLKDSQISMPSDLFAAHERTSSAVRAIIEEIQRKNETEKTKHYQKDLYKKLLNMYAYSDNNYSIIVPSSAADIIQEGKVQQHCVAGYAERHIQGKLAILFMRKTSEPDKALYTIEMHGKELIQIQGFKNRVKPNETERKWFDRWLRWVRKPEDKKHPNEKTA